MTFYINNSIPPSPSLSSNRVEVTLNVNDLYHVTSEQGAGYYGPMGIRPKLTPISVKWEDTGSGQPVIAAVDIKVDGKPLSPELKATPNEIIITKRNGKKVTFKLLDVNLYNTFRDGTMPEFKTTEELRSFYLNHNFL